MPWAVRRRIIYLLGVFAFFVVTIGGPIFYKLSTVPPTCTDGIQNQGEVSPDRGGPCPLLDAAYLQPSAVLWARTFPVRDGSYNAAAYIENPNEGAGVRDVGYRFKIYDAENVLVAERIGSTYVMPGRITPVFVAGLDTGNRKATHAFFAFTDAPVWEQMKDAASVLDVTQITSSDVAASPRVSAEVRNRSVRIIFDVDLVATVFDTAGNAYASSATHIARLAPDESQQVVFTWPDPFPSAVGRIDVIPRVAPLSTASAR
jgi:hypothetical protein